MKKVLLIVCMLFALVVPAQHTYFGLTGDFNTGIGERYTYSTGLHLEMAVRGCNNLYFNWHYSLGTNTHNEAYAHGPITLLMYNHHLLPDLDVQISDWRFYVLMLFGPACCPSGMTYYLPKGNNLTFRNYRFGFYCDPLGLDCWQLDRKVTSWTIDGGAKCMISTRSSLCLYLAAGAAFTNNLERGSHGYGDELLFQVQVGMINAGDYLQYRKQPKTFKVLRFNGGSLRTDFS